VPTPKRPQIINGQYLRIPSRFLNGVLNEEVIDDVVAVVAMCGVG
jgi:hypothetical protein